MTKEEFLEKAKEAARAASAKSGLPMGITVAQAALESAWGRSELSCRWNNYFGIKAHGAHGAVELATKEVTNGIEERTIAKFASYGSMAECFDDRDRLILTSRYYAATRACAGDAESFAVELGKRWATDPRYSEKLLKIYRANGLEKLDSPKG